MRQPGPTVPQAVLASTEQALSFARQELAELVVDRLKYIKQPEVEAGTGVKSGYSLELGRNHSIVKKARWQFGQYSTFKLPPPTHR